MPRELITRRHLPHWYVPGAAHFITYRLAGTIPTHVLDEMKARKESLFKRGPPPGMAKASFNQRIQKLYFAEFDKYLDNHREIRWLADPRVAEVIRENLYHHNGKKYQLIAYCVMPNHVHVLLQPIDAEGSERPKGQARLPVLREESTDAGGPLAKIMHSLKSYTANEINKILGRSGQLWQDESYDHWVRDDDELERIVIYIASNPVKAGLVHEPHEWPFCSAHDRFAIDGSREAWLLP